MSSIESNNQSLNNILEKIGVKSPENTATKPKSSLGQEDFPVNDNTAPKSGSFSLQWRMASLLPKWHSFQRLLG